MVVDGEDIGATVIAEYTLVVTYNPCPGFTVGKTDHDGGSGSRSPPLVTPLSRSAKRAAVTACQAAVLLNY
jgi:hypothetical protein